MNTVGRSLSCMSKQYPIRRPSWPASFHTMQIRRPTVCCSRITAFIQRAPLRGKRILSKKPIDFTAKLQQDRIPAGYELVYVNNMNRYYTASQVVIYGLLSPTLCLCVYLLWQHHKSLGERVRTEGLDHPYVIVIPATLFGIGFMYFTNSVCRRAIIRMYHNADEKTYMAVTQKWNMMREPLKFTSEDCVPQSKASMSIRFMLGGNVVIKGQTFLLRDTDFRQPSYYNDLMGWDRAQEDRAEKVDDDLSKLIRKK